MSSLASSHFGFLSLILAFIIQPNSVFSQNKNLSKVDQVIVEARKYMGTPYGKDGLDCSLLTQKCFASVGEEIGRSSRDQIKYGLFVNKSQLRRGDLIFFDMGDRIGHVGIVVSHAHEPIRFIHTSYSRGVTESLLSSKYWSKRYASARRVIHLRRKSIERQLAYRKQEKQSPLSSFLSDLD